MFRINRTIIYIYIEFCKTNIQREDLAETINLIANPQLVTYVRNLVPLDIFYSLLASSPMQGRYYILVQTKFEGTMKVWLLMSLALSISIYHIILVLSHNTRDLKL